MFLGFSIAVLCAQAYPVDYLAVDGILLGTRSEKGWAHAGQQFLSSPMVEVGIGRLGEVHANYRVGVAVSGIETAPEALMPSGVFYSGKVWQPRAIKPELNRDAALYAAIKIAREREDFHPFAYLRGVWRLDLDGDGKAEELSAAISRPQALRGMARDGDWQVVLLRSKDKLNVRTSTLAASFPRPGKELGDCRLRAVADFDGDGKMEFVTSNVQSGFMTATLWKFVGGRLIPILEASHETVPLAK
jgi:hypothetical protein